MSEKNESSGGRVYLVGAGPGDPGLITLRGVELLRRADVVIYDFLVNPLILSHARWDAEKICLGRHGTGRILPQDEVNRQLIALAQDGKQVVRLKGGDPAVFARSAEEADALSAAKIPFEIVPGITAALAASSYAGVSITHRDHASAVALVTGQERSDAMESKLDYGALATFPGTLVFYMGVTTAPHWTQSLIDAGLDSSTPAAIIRRCSWTDQQVIHCTLSTVVDQLKSHTIRPPALIVVGAACGAASTISWYQRRPLFGQSVLVTRPRDQANAMCEQLSELGAGCLVQPAIEISPPSDWTPVDRALQQLDKYDWLIFSSANGVRALLNRLWDKHGDFRRLGVLRLATIGPRTADALADYHLRADIQPDQYRAEALADELASEATGQRFLLARASRGREVLAERLLAAGGIVDEVVVYESRDTARPDEEIAAAVAEGRIDWITVTSSAIARSLVAMFGDELRKCRLASVSPITSAALRECGHEPAIEAENYTTAGIIDAIIRAGTVDSASSS